MKTEKIFKKHLIQSISKQRAEAAKELEQVEQQLLLKPNKGLAKLRNELLEGIQIKAELIEDLEKLK